MWVAEDGGPRRQQLVPGRLDAAGSTLTVTSRFDPVMTMPVGAGGALYLLRHTAGEGAVAMVERIDPVTLEPVARSVDLPGGPVWPGGLAVHASGDVHVVFGNHAHRLSPDLEVLASATLPRAKPYNSFVTLADGHLVTKDFGADEPAELLVLDPTSLAVVASLALPEASVARLSADGDDIYVVGVDSLLRVRHLEVDLMARYRTLAGQTFGWDCVIAAGAAWFLDDGDGSEQFDGTLRGKGRSTAPLHLVRVDLETGAVRLAEVCGRPGGLIANPPVVDEGRGVVVGYDSGNGVMTAFDLVSLAPVWTREQDHASHLLLYADSGELVTGDGTDVVVLDVATGDELARADSGSPIQSVVFPCPGRPGERVFYVTSLASVSRVVCG